MKKSQKPDLEIYDEVTYGTSRVMLQTGMYSEKDLQDVIDAIRKMNKINKQQLNLITNKAVANEKIGR